MAYSKIINLLIWLLLLLLAAVFLRLFLADLVFTRALRYKYYRSFDETYRSLRQSVALNPTEPLYRRELAALLSEWAQEETGQSSPEAGKTAGILAEEARREAARALQLNPYNSLTYKSLLKTADDLSRTFGGSYSAFAETVGEALLRLSPTEAHSRYSVALVYARRRQKEKAVKLAEEAILLKPDYKEARELKELLTDQ